MTFKKLDSLHRRAFHSGLPRLRVGVFHLDVTAQEPQSSRHWLKPVLQAVVDMHVDVLSGDVNQAATTCHRKQSNADIENSTMCSMIKEAVSETNKNVPFEKRLHAEYIANNLITKFADGSDLDCCFTAVFRWGKAASARLAREANGTRASEQAISSG